MPTSRQLPRCSLDHRSQLLEAAAGGAEPFWEVLDAYPEEEPYFWTVAQNVKAELVAAFQQGLQAGAGPMLTNRQGYWTMADGTDYPPKRLAGCIAHDSQSEEVFWILRSVSSFRKGPSARDEVGEESRPARRSAGLGLDVDSLLRVWFNAGEAEDGAPSTGAVKGLRPSFDLLSMDACGANSMDACDRAIEVVMFAADYGERYAAALRGASDLADRDLLTMVLTPARARPGSYARMSQRIRWGGAHELNAPQLSAVANLRHRLEVIHGPPGTGKSTTIFGLLSARVPSEQTACVTCVTNQAVEAVCEKLRAVRWHLPFTVLGNPDSLGPCSKRFLLEQQVAREDEVVQAREAWLAVQQEVEEAEVARVAVGSGTEEFYRLNRRLVYLKEELEACRTDLDAAAEFAARGIVRGTRVFVCTIASLHRITALEQHFGPDFPGAPHTIVVDEAGATPESYVPQILQTGVQNLVLLGDHKQLPPLVLTLDMADMEGKLVNRSPLERALVQMPEDWVHRLTVQYRMPATICKLVSKLFYESALTTGTDPRAKGKKPISLSWLVVKHTETSVGTSWQNLGEAAVIVAWLRRKVPEARQQGKTVKCLTFYRLQRNLIQAGLDDEEMKACVLSVDATQGSEADHVILSTVRSNEKCELGFCADPRRLCVALSRAKESLTIVGDPGCMCTGLWAEVWTCVEAKQERPPACDLEAMKAAAVPKTQICRYFLRGRCTRSDCAFIHGEQLMPATPLDKARATQVSPSKVYPSPCAIRPRAGRVPCQYFAAGRCDKGSQCTFSHDFAPGDRRVRAEIRASAKPCQFHAMGKCSKGEACSFSHNFLPGNRRVAAHLRKTAELCQFYAQGRCRNGASCVFLHR